MDEPKGNEMTDPTTGTSAVVAPGAIEPQLADVGAFEEPAEGAGSHAGELEQAIQGLLAQVGTGVVSVSRVVNPLLQVWSVARDVDAEVAVPVENLLTVLVGRSLTTSDELSETMTEVRAVLAGTSPLASV